MVKTKTITIDLQAHRILKNIKAIMNGKGKSATLSLVICDLAMHSIDLCETCEKDTLKCGFERTCGTIEGYVTNVFDCVGYKHRGDSK